MPELPEVQTIVEDLNQMILNTTIVKVEISLKKIIKNTYSFFIDNIVGSSFKKITRRGKLIIMEINKKDKFLLIHLRMTGQIVYKNNNNIIAGGHSDTFVKFNLPLRDFNNLQLFGDGLPNKQTHVVFFFKDGGKMFYNDQRQFGILQVVNKKELDSIISKFGIEPLSAEFTLKMFLKIINGKKTNIKAFLLNQKYIAGIGNIYADEILFDALILPTRKINSLKKYEIKCLYFSIKKILTKAIISRGTTFNNYVDANGNNGEFLKFLKVYQREGENCKRCKKGKIKKIKLVGRGTCFCKGCQK